MAAGAMPKLSLTLGYAVAYVCSGFCYQACRIAFIHPRVELPCAGTELRFCLLLQGDHKSPMQYIAEAEPIKVHGTVVASYGSDDPALGCPVEYINLKGSSYDNPKVCKYTGNRYYSDDWKSGGHH